MNPVEMVGKIVERTEKRREILRDLAPLEDKARMLRLSLSMVEDDLAMLDKEVNDFRHSTT